MSTECNSLSEKMQVFRVTNKHQACCEPYLARIALMIRNSDNLSAGVSEVCFEARQEFDRLFGPANPPGRSLILLMQNLNQCSNRREEIEAVFRITELLNALNDQYRRSHGSPAPSRRREFQLSVLGTDTPSATRADLNGSPSV